MSEIKPGNMIGAEALAIARGNARALDIVIGLLAKRYPRDLIPKFIRECVELKQEDLLNTTRMEGLAFLADTLGGETYDQLVNFLAEQAALDLEKVPEVELVYDLSIEKEYRAEQAAKKAGSKPAAGQKTKTATVRKAATAAKKTAARKATGEKNGGAADGK